MRMYLPRHLGRKSHEIFPDNHLPIYLIFDKLLPDTHILHYPTHHTSLFTVNMRHKPLLAYQYLPPCPASVMPHLTSLRIYAETLGSVLDYV